MSESITSVIKTIKDSALAKLRVARGDGGNEFLDCIYKESEAPGFFLMFPPDSFPGDIEPGQNCSVAIHREDEPLTLAATIQGQIGDRGLELSATNTIDPVSLREYFRVALTTSIIASFDPGEESRQRPWQVRGTTIDLSGTGVLAVFSQQFENRNNITIELRLPDVAEPILCVGHVVRMKKLRKQRFQIALHFDEISRKHRDVIITACLQEQRRQLRLRMEAS